MSERVKAVDKEVPRTPMTIGVWVNWRKPEIVKVRPPEFIECFSLTISGVLVYPTFLCETGKPVIAIYGVHDEPPVEPKEPQLRLELPPLPPEIRQAFERVRVFLRDHDRPDLTRFLLMQASGENLEASERKMLGRYQEGSGASGRPMTATEAHHLNQRERGREP